MTTTSVDPARLSEIREQVWRDVYRLRSDDDWVAVARRERDEALARAERAEAALANAGAVSNGGNPATVRLHQAETVIRTLRGEAGRLERALDAEWQRRHRTAAVWRAYAASVTAQIDDIETGVTQLVAERDAAIDKLGSVNEALDGWMHGFWGLETQLSNVRSERDAAVAELNSARAELDSVRRVGKSWLERDAATVAELDSLRRELSAARLERDAALAEGAQVRERNARPRCPSGHMLKRGRAAADCPLCQRKREPETQVETQAESDEEESHVHDLSGEAH